MACRSRLNLASPGPLLQTRQTVATRTRIDELEPHLNPIGVTSGFLDADYPVVLDSAPRETRAWKVLLRYCRSAYGGAFPRVEK